jgi:hypothetical protein
MASMLERQLSLAEEHVAKGERHVSRQRELIAELEQNGHHELAERARALVGLFEEVQAMHIADRDRLLKQFWELK